jgi:hypothetical protein
VTTRWAAVAPVVGAVGAVALTAFVSVPPVAAGAPTRASWAAAANRTCAAGYAEIRALPKPKTKSIFIADVRRTLRIGKRLTRQLSAIPAPPSERGTIRKLVTAGRALNRGIQLRLLPAMVKGNWDVAQRITESMDPLNARFNRLSRSLGARVCAENPAPRG